MGVRASVVVSTFRQPSALALCLGGLERQTRLDFEVLVADDGPEPASADIVSEAARRPGGCGCAWSRSCGGRLAAAAPRR